jgi:hypothetical protein
LKQTLKQRKILGFRSDVAEDFLLIVYDVAPLDNRIPYFEATQCPLLHLHPYLKDEDKTPIYAASYDGRTESSKDQLYFCGK